MATTINSYNVKLSMDAKGYIDPSRLARQETGQLIRIINESRSPADKFAKSIGLIERAHQKGAIQAGTYNTLLDRQWEKLRKTDQATAGLVGSVKGLAASYLGFAAVTGVVKKSIGLAIEVEQAETQFKVLTNSANNAKVLMGDLRSFAAKSPISFSGAADSARTMLLFNVQVQDVMRNVKVLGEITGGNTERFKNLTLAFSQMTSAGRLMGGELRQMVEAGFNPLQQISLKTGESMLQLKDRMEDGAVSAQEVTQAFIDATAEGGRFHGMTDEIANTMGGKLTIAMSELEMAGVKLGEALSPLVITMTQGFTDSIGPLSRLVRGAEALSDAMGLSAAYSQDFIAAFQRAGETMKLAGDIFRPGSGGLLALRGQASGGTFDNVNKFLDLLDKRNMEREEARKNPLGELDKTKQPIHMLADSVKDLGKEAEKTERKVKDIGRAMSEQQRQQEALQRLESRRMETALRSAQSYFETERSKDSDRIKQLAGTSIQSMEVGSAEAIKYLAGQHNARLARGSRPAIGQETPRQLIMEAEKQYKILVEQEKKQGRQIKVLEQILEAQRNNGFKRIR